MIAVHQEIHLLAYRTVAENVFLGRQPTNRAGLIDWRRMNADAAALLDRLGLDTIDFYSSLLLAKTVQSVRVVGNIGLGILGDPLDDGGMQVILEGLSDQALLSRLG